MISSVYASNTEHLRRLFEPRLRMARTRQTARESHESRSSSTPGNQSQTSVDKLRMGQALASPSKDEATVKNEANGDDEATARDNEPKPMTKQPPTFRKGNLNRPDSICLRSKKKSHTITKNSQTIKNRQRSKKNSQTIQRKMSNVDERKKMSVSPQPMDLIPEEPLNEHSSRASTPLSQISE